MQNTSKFSNIQVQYQQILVRRIVIQSAVSSTFTMQERIKTEYQLRFTCGTHSTDNCM